MTKCFSMLNVKNRQSMLGLRMNSDGVYLISSASFSYPLTARIRGFFPKRGRIPVMSVSLSCSFWRADRVCLTSRYGIFLVVSRTPVYYFTGTAMALQPSASLFIGPSSSSARIISISQTAFSGIILVLQMRNTYVWLIWESSDSDAQTPIPT